MIDLTSKTKILPNGSKFPDTPMPIIIKENFGSVEVINPNKGGGFLYGGFNQKKEKLEKIRKEERY